ncbi:hypothetical protein BU15DRAFT_74098 [Melanogaster broomeanus]|nr:hypothetical protein BU15DRAFT_74098 [Melanogaster broomeanus]
MAPTHPFDHLSPAKQAEFRHCFPRAGFWLDPLPPPPDSAPYYPHTTRNPSQPTPLTGPGVPPPPYHTFAPASYIGEELVVAQAIPAISVPRTRLLTLAANDMPMNPNRQPAEHPPVTHLDFPNLCTDVNQRAVESRLPAIEQDIHRAPNHNLKPVTRTTVSAADSNVKKRKASQSGDDEPEHSTLDFTEDPRRLKDHLLSVKHTGRWRFVSPIDGEHNELDHDALTLWAKKILLGEATLEQPPSSLLHRRGALAKRRRTTIPLAADATVTTSTNSVPAIHLANLPLGDRASTAPLEAPMTLAGANNDLNDSERLIEYPAIEKALRDLNVVMPATKILQFLTAFSSHGIYYVDAAQALSYEFLANEIGMPHGIIHRFQNHIAYLVRKAKKGSSTSHPSASLQTLGTTC